MISVPSSVNYQNVKLSTLSSKLVFTKHQAEGYTPCPALVGAFYTTSRSLESGQYSCEEFKPKTSKFILQALSRVDVPSKQKAL